MATKQELEAQINELTKELGTSKEVLTVRNAEIQDLKEEIASLKNTSKAVATEEASQPHHEFQPLIDILRSVAIGGVSMHEGRISLRRWWFGRNEEQRRKITQEVEDLTKRIGSISDALVQEFATISNDTR